MSSCERSRMLAASVKDAGNLLIRRSVVKLSRTQLRVVTCSVSGVGDNGQRLAFVSLRQQIVELCLAVRRRWVTGRAILANFTVIGVEKCKFC